MHNINPLKTQLNPICHLLALLGAHHILHVSRIRVNTLEKVATQNNISDTPGKFFNVDRSGIQINTNLTQ